MNTEAILSKRYAIGLPHWRPSQRRRLRELMAEGVTIAYWCSDAHGYPANGGTREPRARARPGLVQTIPGPLRLCGPGALHATLEPHRWAGTRVWVVALHGEVQWDNDKCGSLRREFVGEVLPHEAFDPCVGVRVGRKDLRGADLHCAYLSSANLSGSDLRGANLRGANLRGANLRGAYLRKGFV